MARNRQTTDMLRPFAVELGVVVNAARPCNVCHGTGMRFGAATPVGKALYTALNGGRGERSSYALVDVRGKMNGFKVDDLLWLAEHHFGGDLAAAIDFRDRLARTIAAHDEEDKE
jgi:hypothetical protein